MKTFEQLENQVIEWATTKGIFEKSSAEKQFLKSVEEMGELSREFQIGNRDAVLMELGDVVITAVLLNRFINPNLKLSQFQPEIWDEDGIQMGDVFISLCESVCGYALWRKGFKMHQFVCEVETLANYYNSTIEECLSLAYEKISKRKGEMVNGLFVKEN